MDVFFLETSWGRRLLSQLFSEDRFRENDDHVCDSLGPPPKNTADFGLFPSTAIMAPVWVADYLWVFLARSRPSKLSKRPHVCTIHEPSTISFIFGRHNLKREFLTFQSSLNLS